MREIRRRSVVGDRGGLSSLIVGDGGIVSWDDSVMALEHRPVSRFESDEFVVRSLLNFLSSSHDDDLAVEKKKKKKRRDKFSSR